MASSLSRVMKQTCPRTAAINSIAEKLASATMMMNRFDSQRLSWTYFPQMEAPNGLEICYFLFSIRDGWREFSAQFSP
jgi:hypothetical protein